METRVCTTCNLERNISEYKNGTATVCNICKADKLRKYQETNLGYEALDENLEKIIAKSPNLKSGFLISYQEAKHLVKSGKANVYASDVIYILGKPKIESINFAIPIYDTSRKIVDVIENPELALIEKVYNEFEIDVYMDCSSIDGLVVGTAVLFIGRGQILSKRRYDRGIANASFGEAKCFELALRYLLKLDYSKYLHNDYKVNIHTDHLTVMHYINGTKKPRGDFKEIINKVMRLKNILEKKETCKC